MSDEEDLAPMHVWMHKITGTLFVVRPWYEVAGGSHFQFGWLFQVNDRPEWRAAPRSPLIENEFENLGEL